MKTKFVCTAFVVFFATFTAHADDIGECLHSDASCEKSLRDRTMTDAMRATIMQVSCEEHKNAKACVGTAAAKGILGLEEVAMGYLELACRLDKSTCKVLTGVKCLKATNKDPECVRDNEFFTLPLAK